MPDNLTCALPDGRTLSYAEYGDPQGRPVFCLHGTPGSRLAYSPADAPAKKRGLRLIAPDRPGCGRSTHLNGWSYDDHMADITHLADRFGLERFSLIGYSGGGPYAAYAARRLRPRMQALMLVNAFAPSGHIGALQHSFLALAKFFPPGLWLAGPAVRLLARSELARVMLHPDASRSDRQAHRNALVRDWLTAMLLDMPFRGRGLMRDAEQFARALPLPAPDGPDAPIWILHGADDSIVRPEAALLYLLMFPNALLTLVPNAGHFWGIETSDALLDAHARLLESAH